MRQRTPAPDVAAIDVVNGMFGQAEGFVLRPSPRPDIVCCCPRRSKAVRDRRIWSSGEASIEEDAAQRACQSSADHHRLGILSDERISARSPSRLRPQSGQCGIRHREHRHQLRESGHWRLIISCRSRCVRDVPVRYSAGARSTRSIGGAVHDSKFFHEQPERVGRRKLFVHTYAGVPP